MFNMEFNTEADMKPLNYSDLMFRFMNMIQSLSSKDYQDRDSKLFDFTWSVKMFKASIPEAKMDKKFKDDYVTWGNETIGGYQDKFDHYIELYNMCMNLLARSGVLFKHVKNGSY